MVPGFTAKEIKPTKTVGQRLQATRKKKELSLEEAERLTKVKLKYLEALEADRHDLLPTEVYSLGFLRCYGEVIGLNTAKLLEQYRLERQAVKSAQSQPVQNVLAPARRLPGPRFLLTPRTLFSLGSAALVVGLLVYIVSGVHSFLAPPTLFIDQPKADSRVASDKVTASGATDPAVSLTINGELVNVGPDGKFTRTIAVAPGLNSLEFVATNRIGKQTSQTRKILATYSPEPTSSASLLPTPVSTSIIKLTPSGAVSP